MPGLLSDLDLTKQIDDKSDYRQRVQDLQLNLLHFQRKTVQDHYAMSDALPPSTCSNTSKRSFILCNVIERREK